MKVHEIMTAHARCAGPNNSLVEAAGAMRQLNVGALPVCEDDRIVGIITDRDIAVRAVADGRDPNTTLVREVMSTSVAFAMADQDVEEAARLMQQREIRRLPVLNRTKRLVGVLALADIAMSSNPAFSGMTLREVSEPEHPNGRQRKRDALGRAAGAVQPLRSRFNSGGDDSTASEAEKQTEPKARKQSGGPHPAGQAKTSSRRSTGGDRSRVSSEKHEVNYAGKKVGKRGAARVRKAKKASGRKTGRKAVMRRARSTK